MFEDRVDAALKLCPKIIDDANDKNVLGVGLFRGGLVVAATIAQKLNLKYSPLIVKKLSFPQNPELAFGAMLTLSDVYINNKYILTAENDPLNISFVVSDLGNISETNTVTVTTYDQVYNKSSASASFVFVK